MKATKLLHNFGQRLGLCRWLILGTLYPGAALVVGPVLIVGPDGVARTLSNRLAHP